MLGACKRIGMLNRWQGDTGCFETVRAVEHDITHSTDFFPRAECRGCAMMAFLAIGKGLCVLCCSFLGGGRWLLG